MIKELSIDLETYSDVDISKCGAYKYAESDHFEILLFGVSVDNGPVVVYDLTAGDEIPTEILEALSDENITKWAFNASFERVCLSNWLRKHHPEYFKSYNSEDDPVTQLSGSILLEMHYDLVSLYGPTTLTGSCWCSPEASGSENEGR